MAGNHTLASCTQYRALLCNHHAILLRSCILLYHYQDLRMSQWSLYAVECEGCTAHPLSGLLDLRKIKTLLFYSLNTFIFGTYCIKMYLKCFILL